MRGPVSLALSLVVPMLLAAQAPAGVAEHIARGDSAHAALAPPQALEQYRAALAVDSTHDGGYHLLGAWHAEVKRLSGFEKFFAKTLYGGGFLDKGNWEDAQKYLQKAVALKPSNIFHRLELGEVYVDLGQYSKAREQFNAIEPLPIADVLDPQYKKEAKQILDDIKGEKDEKT